MAGGSDGRGVECTTLGREGGIGAAPAGSGPSVAKRSHFDALFASRGTGARARSRRVTELVSPARPRGRERSRGGVHGALFAPQSALPTTR